MVGLGKSNCVVLVIEDRVELSHEGIAKDDDRVPHAELDVHDGNASLAFTISVHDVIIRGELIGHGLAVCCAHIDLKCFKLV